LLNFDKNFVQIGSHFGLTVSITRTRGLVIYVVSEDDVSTMECGGKMMIICEDLPKLLVPCSYQYLLIDIYQSIPRELFKYSAIAISIFILAWTLKAPDVHILTAFYDHCFIPHDEVVGDLCAIGTRKPAILVTYFTGLIKQVTLYNWDCC